MKVCEFFKSLKISPDFVQDNHRGKFARRVSDVALLMAVYSPGLTAAPEACRVGNQMYL